MDIKLGLMVVGVAYCMIYFFDSFFKSCAHYPYIKFLEGTGLKIGFFNLQWSTTAFNRALLRLGNVRSNTKFLNVWFSLGLIASLILLPIAIVLLIYSLLQHFISPHESNLITPVIPGINLPASEIFFYSATLIICSVLHEFGHALAAVKEDVQILNLGVNVFFILPVAYVNLNSENLRSIDPWKRLKVLTAGIWHNLLLSFVCYLLYLSLPSILSVAFNSGKGVAIYDASRMSPLIGDKGLDFGDRITEINGCEVKTEDSWVDCLQNVNKRNGMCFDPDTVRELDETSMLRHLSNGLVECCEETKKGNVCFEFIDKDGSVLELPSHVCLPARTIMSKSKFYCSKLEHNCPKGLRCFVPQLNGTHLFKIGVLNKPVVFYMGLTDDFLRTLRVSPYIPKFYFKTPVFAETVRKMLEYITIISLGLAIINIVPCFYMDGQHIINTLMYISLSGNFDGDRLVLISSMICLIFTALLIVHCVLTMLPFIF
ncbi:membrane-bound transcription factor site-2 protease [Coccinella septempunctata]|uniref:membrane-bound transcription factor site-2 protease n=1 Tax=Coccinella septempunctata TaxID=41139 RepID=UPI001D08007A|nr:membrane-bound transcription factor site-2 protease [Coccinella septempunctata]